MGDAIAALAFRLSTVAAAGITHDGKGFVHFTNGETVHVPTQGAVRIASSLASGAEFITLYTRENPAGGRTILWDHQLAYPREARDD